jgi:hypothetical protein
MERSAHVLLVGKGAESLARECGLEFRDAEYFITDMRRVQLQHAQAKTDRSGTVGAVARDATGRLAAATSTGGMSEAAPTRALHAQVRVRGTHAALARALCFVQPTSDLVASATRPSSARARSPTTRRVPYRARATASILFALRSLTRCRVAWRSRARRWSERRARHCVGALRKWAAKAG